MTRLPKPPAQRSVPAEFVSKSLLALSYGRHMMGGAFGRAVASDCGSRGGEHTFDSGSAVSFLCSSTWTEQSRDFQPANLIESYSALAPSATSPRLDPETHAISPFWCARLHSS